MLTNLLLREQLDEKDLLPSTLKSADFSGRISPATVCSIVQIVVLVFERFLWCLSVKTSQQFLQWYLGYSMFFQRSLKKKNACQARRKMFWLVTSQLLLATRLVSWKVSVKPWFWYNYEYAHFNKIKYERWITLEVTFTCIF